jgi:hypothetical protein
MRAPATACVSLHPTGYPFTTKLTPSLDARRQALQAPPHVVYAYFKYTWAQGSKQNTLAWIQGFTLKLTADLGLESPDFVPAPEARNEFTQLLARCYLKLGEWDVALREGRIVVRGRLAFDGRASGPID